MRRVSTGPRASAAGRWAMLGMVPVALVAMGNCVEAQTLGEVIEESRATIERYLADSPTPGLSIAVHMGDSLVWTAAFGVANVELGVPVTTETLFRIGSISKALTSAAVGLLYERGRLDLDAPVQTYVPSFPEKRYPITTRQLGGHLSGLPHYAPEDFQNFVPYAGVVEALDKFKERPLLFRPGERFEYSSFGFNLISAVVEGAAGRPFLEFMQEEVFEPLGMDHTVPDAYRSIVPHRTGFYEVDEEGRVANARFTDNSDVWAGGGYLSTPTDLVTFAAGLLDGDLLRPETLEVLFTSMTTTDGEATGYGFGWRVQDSEGGRTVSHGGGHFGATALLTASTSPRLILAATANMSGADFREPLETIREKFRTLAGGS